MDQPRARGFVKLSAKYVEGRSRIDKLHQSGSLKVLFPRNQASFLQAVTVNTAGGATGGDQFKIDATVKKNACLTLTTQAAERAYMAQKFTAASIHNKVTVEKNAQLHWMPQETILFENSNLSRSLIIDMHETSKCLLVEPLVFGRIASGERLNSAKIKEHKKIGKILNVTVDFIAEIITCIKDKDKKIISGDPEKIKKIYDTWVFSRDTTSGNPNWKLVNILT